MKKRATGGDSIRHECSERRGRGIDELTEDWFVLLFCRRRLGFCLWDPPGVSTVRTRHLLTTSTIKVNGNTFRGSVIAIFGHIALDMNNN
ncbi:hypothetical protein PGB90_003755 [Kerria lacca]